LFIGDDVEEVNQYAAEDAQAKQAEEDFAAMVEFSKGPVSHLSTWKYFSENTVGFKCRLCPDVKLLSEDDAIRHLHTKKHLKNEKCWIIENRTEEEIDALKAKNAKKKEKRLKKAAGQDNAPKRDKPETPNEEGQKKKKKKKQQAISPVEAESTTEKKKGKKPRVRPGKRERQKKMGKGAEE
jgi:hypothetical protein